jgi:indolepyruvate ferredoxin oxidoreductase alpha subunit
VTKHIMLENKKTKCLAYGFEAVARGALEAGVRVVAGFPGNPTNRVIEAFGLLGKRDDLYVEWSTGEKVAFEVAWGASLCGQRAMCSVNMLGTNCLVDALQHAMHHCSRGGLVLLSGDDIGGNTSALEVDTRLIGDSADMPILEPADGQEALEMARFSFYLSEQVELPVMLRGVGKVMMSRTGVETGDIELIERESHFHDPEEDLPFEPGVNFQVVSHRLIHNRLEKAGQILEGKLYDRMELIKDARVGILGCGVGYHLAQEALSDLGLTEQASFLKLGVVNPLNTHMITEFLQSHEVVLCVEEGEAFVEQRVLAIVGQNGIKTKILGRLDRTLPTGGEIFLPDLVKGIERTFKAIGKDTPSHGMYAGNTTSGGTHADTVCWLPASGFISRLAGSGEKDIARSLCWYW